MNILHIAPYYPSVNAMHAGGVAMGHEILILKNLGHIVYTLSFLQKKYDLELFKKQKEKNDDGIVIGKKEKIKNIIFHPILPIEFASRVNKNFLEKILYYIDTFDIDCIHSEYTAMLWYVQIKKLRPKVKFIAVLHDITIQSYERKYKNEKKYYKKLYFFFEKERVNIYEKMYLKKCDLIMSFSEKDKRLVFDNYGLNSVAINTFFDLESIKKKRNAIKRIDDGKFSVCFMGQMGREDNHKAALRLIDIFNQLEIENKKLYIIGIHPKEKLINMGNANIEITGFVEDIDGFILQKCDVACFPFITGAGIKIKVLECLALGLPVVTNDIGAEGIDENGEYIYLADSDDDFIRKIKETKKNISSYMSKFDEEFSWRKTERVMEEAYGKSV